MPIRSQYGFHLINTVDKIPAQGTKKVSHIIVMNGPLYAAKDSAQAVARIQEAYQKCKSGSDFAALAKEYSNDPRSSDKGGDLGTGRLLPEMETWRRKLNKDQFSEPFKSAYGWHIMKITEAETLKTFAQMKNELKAKVSRDTRAKVAEDKLLEKLKKQYKYILNPATITALASKAGENYLKTTFNADSVDENTKKLIAFTYADQKTSVKELLEFVPSNRRTQPKGTPEDAAKADAEALAAKKLLEYKEQQLTKEEPDFKELTKEYRDGILLFALTEQRVWRKAVEDTAGLKDFFTRNPQKFQAKERIQLKEYRSTDSAAIVLVKQWLTENKDYTFIDTTLQSQRKPVRSVTLYHQQTDNELAKSLFPKPIGTSTDIINENNYFIVRSLQTKLPTGTKTFDEARSEAITHYQNELETNWMTELKNRYPTEIVDAVLNRLFK